MKRATALAVPVRRLSWSISSHFVAIQPWNVPAVENRKKHENLLFSGFKVIQGHRC